MKIEPVRYRRLMMQLISPTPMNAPRHARSASPSSERRTPGTAAIYQVSFKWPCEAPISPGIPIGYNTILPVLTGTVQRPEINQTETGPFHRATGVRVGRPRPPLYMPDISANYELGQNRLPPRTSRTISSRM